MWQETGEIKKLQTEVGANDRTITSVIVETIRIMLLAN